MRRWPLLVVWVLGCADDGDGADAGGAEISDPTEDSGSTGADETADDDPSTDPSTDPTTDPDSDDTDPSADDEGSSDDGGPIGPTCGGVFWRAQMDVDPTTIDDNGDGVNDWEFNAGAFPAATLVDGVWQVPAGAYIRTLPDDPLATRVIVSLSMRATSTEPRGALFWANLGQQGDSVTRLWLELSLGEDGTQRALVGGYSSSEMPEVLLDVPDLDTGFVDVVLDADPTTGEAAVTIAGVDHGTIQLPSYQGSNPQAAAVGSLDATAEIDSAIVEVCP